MFNIKEGPRCANCDEERGWTHTKAKCWDKWGMCRHCAEKFHPEDYHYSWKKKFNVKCPKCDHVFEHDVRDIIKTAPELSREERLSKALKIAESKPSVLEQIEKIVGQYEHNTPGVHIETEEVPAEAPKLKVPENTENSTS